MNHIDYSQYSMFLSCPWQWYERYVAGWAPNYGVRQRDDALALGSLVHNGLDNFSKSGRPYIDNETLLDVNPTPECFQLAEMMVQGYIQKYPRERWPIEATEEAVKFDLCSEAFIWLDNYVGIAKLDGRFYVPEDTTIESGLPGTTLTLSRGWWSREYKTKSPGINRGTWLSEWASKRQADFQILALKHLLRKGWEDATIRTQGGQDESDQVQGVLVSVLEKPRQYTPKRKCKGCGESWEMESYFVTAEGHACPSCQAVQHLKPYTPTRPAAPEFFRMVVTRSARQLEIAKGEITAVAEAMDQMREEGMQAAIPNRDNCMTNRYHKKCDYAEHHITGRPVGAPDYIQIDPYKYLGML